MSSKQVKNSLSLNKITPSGSEFQSRIKLQLLMKKLYLMIGVLVLGITQLNAQNYIKQFESLHANTRTRLYPTYDNQLIYTTDWARYIYKIDANMNTTWRIEPRGAQTPAVSYNYAHDSGIYLFGSQGIFNFVKNRYDERYLWINKLDACNNKVWSKIIAHKDIFTDTIFLNTETRDFAFMQSDEQSNLYFGISDENNLYPYDSMQRGTIMMYKITPNGELVYRVPIFDKRHWSPITNASHYYNGKIYLSGNVMLEDRPQYPGIAGQRAFLQMLDTSGKIIKQVNFSKDTMYLSKLARLKFNPYSKTLLADVVGRRIDTVNLTDIYENNLILYDSMLNELKRITINETQYGYGNYEAIDVDTAGNFLIAFINIPPVDTIFDADNRPSKLYFLRMNHKLEIIDSVHIDFLPHKNINDTATIINKILPNPQNLTGYIMSGMRAYGKNPFHRILFRVTPDLRLDTSTYPASPKDYYCSETLINKVIQLEFTDTIYIVIEHKRPFKIPYNSILENSISAQQITTSPNPATKQVHIESPIKIEQYKLTNTNGATMQSGVLDASNNIDVSQLPPGIYFLQLQLENGQMVVKKLVRSSK
jgi:hypothetical protein